MATLTYNASSWSQDRKNGVVAACVELLHLAGITHGTVTRTVSGTDVVVDVPNPSSDPTATLAQSAVETKWDEQEAARVAALTAIQAETTLRLSEESSNPIFGLSWSQIEGRFDSHVTAITAARTSISNASNLTQAKAGCVALADADLGVLADLRRLVRLLRARGALDKTP